MPSLVVPLGYLGQYSGTAVFLLVHVVGTVGGGGKKGPSAKTDRCGGLILHDPSWRSGYQESLPNSTMDYVLQAARMF